MSALNYDGPRRLPRTNSALTFPQTYHSEHSAALGGRRTDPYASSRMGGPVNRLRNRPQASQDDYEPEHGGLRRRIAVACARCRKRKIRCSGSFADGKACHNCKAAGVEDGQCQYHRVGSDHVHKVMDNMSLVQSLVSMASGHDSMPLYSVGGNGSYHRGLESQSYPPLDKKPASPHLDSRSAYNSGWIDPYDEISYDQSGTYLSTPTIPTSSDVFDSSYRCSSPPRRTSQVASSFYSDYGQPYNSNGLSYVHTDLQPVVPSEPVSPLNMPSLQITLPERPRQRQMQPTEVPLTPQRRLPAPQPTQGFGLHHALDQQQDQRLRASQKIASPSFSNVTLSYPNTGSYLKPLLSWTTANENLMSTVTKASATTMRPPPPPPPPSLTPREPTAAAATSPNFFRTGTSTMSETVSANIASSNALDFGVIPTFDPYTTTIPASPAYSNLRESRDLSSSSPMTQLPRNNSTSSLYSYDSVSRRPSLPGDRSSSNLISGHRYTPLGQSSGATRMENLTRESFESRSLPLHRASTSNLNNGF